MHLLQRVGGGLSIKTASHGHLYGMCYLLPPKPAVNLLNVAAKVKEDVPLGVHAERQVGIVLIFAVVTVRIPMTEFNVFYVIILSSTAFIIV